MDVLAKRTTQAYNLAPGEPVEVFDSLKERFPLSLLDWNRYPPIGGEPELKNAIRRFLKARGLPSGGHIVVTNGAKQALGAALAELHLRVHGDTHGPHMLMHWGPYWPTLKSIAALHGWKALVQDTTFPEKADIVTSPNNPDGRAMCQSYDRDGNAINGYEPVIYPIWDAAYASPAYGWDGYCVPSRVQVYSMAKLFGVPGVRVGWVHTTDEVAAHFIESYVEVQTSGVNQRSQTMAGAILEYFWGEQRYDAFTKDVYRRLNANRGMLETALQVGYRTQSRDTGEGMYLFIKVLPRHAKRIFRALEKLDVGYVKGEACGLSEKNFARFNLAQDYYVVAKLADALSMELRK